MCELKVTRKDGGGLLSSKTPTICYMGIDQSYTGYAMTLIGTDGTRYHTWLAKSPSTCDPIDRLVALREFVKGVFENLNPDLFFVGAVAMEGYAYSSTMGHMAGELGGVTKLLLNDMGMRPTIVAPAQLKKYITGKGTGVKKNQILLHVFKKWDIEFSDDNMADSYGLARIAAKLSSTSYEEDVIKALVHFTHNPDV
jgi:Holliday junction resolvasome RuvABC endonuclease subunit